MKIYIIAAYPRRKQMQAVARCLEEIGHRVCCSWIHDKDGDGESDNGIDMPELSPERIRTIAYMNLEELARSEAVIIFNEPSDSEYKSGNRYFEHGYIAGLVKAVNIFMDEMPYWLDREYRFIQIGEPELIYDYLSDIERYPDWPTCFKKICAEGVQG